MPEPYSFQGISACWSREISWLIFSGRNPKFEIRNRIWILNRQSVSQVFPDLSIPRKNTFFLNILITCDVLWSMLYYRCILRGHMKKSLVILVIAAGLLFSDALSSRRAAIHSRRQRQKHSIEKSLEKIHSSFTREMEKIRGKAA